MFVHVRLSFSNLNRILLECLGAATVLINNSFASLPVPVYVEKIVDRTIEVPKVVEHIIEVPVPVEKIVYLDRDGRDITAEVLCSQLPALFQSDWDWQEQSFS